MLRCNISPPRPSLSPSERSLWSPWPFLIILKATQTFVCRHKWRQIRWWMKRVKPRGLIDTFPRYANDTMTLLISSAHTKCLLCQSCHWSADFRSALLFYMLRCESDGLWWIFKFCHVQFHRNLTQDILPCLPCFFFFEWLAKTSMSNHPKEDMWLTFCTSLSIIIELWICRHTSIN